MEVFEVVPYGFCEGVVRAISTAYRAKNENPDRDIYVLGMLVHNEEVIADLEKAGISVLNEAGGSLESLMLAVPDNSVIVFSAHGHSPSIEKAAENRGLIIYDATCRYVKDNSNLMGEALRAGHEVIYIGSEGHLECQAALAVSPKIFFYDVKKKNFDFSKLQSHDPIVINQTTISFLELTSIHAEIRENLPYAVIRDERCHSTTLRQQAIVKAPSDSDLFVILGSSASFNTAKLAEIASQTFPKATVFRILGIDDLRRLDLKGHKKAVLASGASTSRETFIACSHFLKSL